MRNYIYHYVSGKEWGFPYLRLFRETSKYAFNNQLFIKKNHFQNKVVIVTGASSGIGRSIAIEFARRGANVILAARNKDKLNELANLIHTIGGLAIVFPTDVTRETDCKALIEGTLSAYGRIDILINNAGISMRANFNDASLEVIKKVMDTNFWGMVYCTKYALPYILKQKGSVVGISSICGITPLPGRTGYSASKHAMDGFLESLRLENLDKGLHVMLVHPGFTTSNIRNVALNSMGEPQIETPLEEDKLMPADRVAREVVIGVSQRKRGITLSTEGKLITWIYRRLPYMADRLIYRELKRESNAPF